MSKDPILRYRYQTCLSDPGDMVSAFEHLPDELPELVRIIQGLMLHVHWAKRYGVTLTEEQKTHVQARAVNRILRVVFEKDPSPLNVARPLEKRFIGNCRDHSLLLCSMLRHKGIPARARCGFGTYFGTGHFEDHWICEHWNGDRWVSTDAQLDQFQREALKLDFSHLDMPEGKFVNASQGWLLCRDGAENPRHFGIAGMSGLWFVRGNLLRELAALNGAEMLPWDMWGLMKKSDEEMTAQELEFLGGAYEAEAKGEMLTVEEMGLLDRVARALSSDSEELHALYDSHPVLQVPGDMMVAGM